MGYGLKTIQRMIYTEVLAKVSFATMGFVGLFFFFDLADELKWIGKGPGQGYAFEHAAAYALLLVPSHVYELLPITVLIGTIFVMAKYFFESFNETNVGSTTLTSTFPFNVWDFTLTK